MTKAEFEFRAVPTFRALNGRFAKATKDLLESRRREMKQQGRRMVDYLQREAPSRTGAFASRIGFRTFVEQNALGFKIHMPQPLGTFISGGTRAHPIVAKRGKTLRFYWDKGPRGAGMYYYFKVNHPGTRPNKFIGRALRRWRPGARQTLRSISLRYAQILEGKKSGGIT